MNILAFKHLLVLGFQAVDFFANFHDLLFDGRGTLLEYLFGVCATFKKAVHFVELVLQGFNFLFGKTDSVRQFGVKVGFMFNLCLINAVVLYPAIEDT